MCFGGFFNVCESGELARGECIGVYRVLKVKINVFFVLAGQGGSRQDKSRGMER